MKETAIPLCISLLLIHVIHSREYIFFSFQIKDVSCRLDSAFGIFSSAGCVMTPEIVVFQEWRVLQRLQAPKLTSASAGKEKQKVFLTSANYCSATDISFFLCAETEVSSFLIKLASVADRTWILLEHCVFARWQCTWDLIRIHLEGDHSSAYPYT